MYEVKLSMEEVRVLLCKFLKREVKIATEPNDVEMSYFHYIEHTDDV